MAELTGVINALLDANLFTIDEVEMCVETAKKTKKELNDELMEMLSNILQSIDD